MLAQGLSEHKDCVILIALHRRCRSLGLRNYPDKTGFESAVNDIHIYDLVEGMPRPRYAPLVVPGAVQVAVNFLASLSTLLREKYPDYAFRGQVSE